MFILNASFIFEGGRESEFLTWFESMRTGIAAGASSRCMVSALRDANGEPFDQAAAHTVAVQWQFDSLAEAQSWRELNIETVTDSFAKTFGTHTVVFTSIFEQIKSYN